MGGLPPIQHMLIRGLKLRRPHIIGIRRLARTAEPPPPVAPYPIIVERPPGAVVIGDRKPPPGPIRQDERQHRGRTAAVLGVSWEGHGRLVMVIAAGMVVVAAGMMMRRMAVAVGVGMM